MENRGQKRSEMIDELPADKRACSSMEFRPISSVQTQINSVNLESESPNQINSAPETQGDMEIQTQINSVNSAPETQGDMEIQIQITSVNSAPETQEGAMDTQEGGMENRDNSVPETQGDMETSSAASASTSRSEGEPEKDSTYGSCDSDGDGDGDGDGDADGDEDGEGDPRQNILREYQRNRSSGDHGKLKRILSNLNEEVDESGHLAVLTELCEVLSFCTEESLSGHMSDSLCPSLVKLAKHESNPDVMLLAIRAITYMCDVYPKSAGFLVRHDAVSALCQRLMAIEYLDVAEQCLQALEKISRAQPLACLQAGAIMAVLNYIDFFSTSIQRVALSTVVNICRKLPSECPTPFMEAVPILCNLLQYEDIQLVEYVATCLIRIVNRVSQSTELLDELCKHGLVHQTTHLIDLNNRTTTLCQPIYTGLIGLLVKLASSSFIAFTTLFELSISSILKDILLSYDLSHGVPSLHVADGHCNQVHEVLKLLNELLPTLVRDKDVQFVLDKESFILNQNDLLQKFGMDILPNLIQVVNSGANLYICYGCLSVINKLVYFSKPDLLLELLKNTNISSFLAGVFTRKDHHVLIVALRIAETILQKLSDYFLNPFIKEGVFFAVDALLTPEKCSQSMFPVFSGIQLSIDSSQKSATKGVLRCLCYAFDTGQSSLASETGACKLEKDSVHNLAKHIRTNYYATDVHSSENGLTDILQKLRTSSAALTDLVNESLNNDVSAQHEDKFSGVLHQILEKLNGSEPISTFEFIESGIVKSLMNYLSNGLYMRDNVERSGVLSHFNIVEKRFEVFARLFLSPMDPLLENLPLSVLIQKVQSALSSLENFPVILSDACKQRNFYATVPSKRSTTYPCIKVRFARGEGETCLSDYSQNIQIVDSFSSLGAIERFLWSKVGKVSTEHINSATEVTGQTKNPTSDASSLEGKVPDLMDIDSVSAGLPEMQVKENVANSLPSVPGKEVNLTQTIPGETSLGETQSIAAGQELQCPSKDLSSKKDDSPKLLFYLEENQLDPSLTLYQSILQQQLKADHEVISGAKVWTQVYTVTYRRAVDPREGYPQEFSQGQDSSSSDEGKYWQYAPFLSGIFQYELASVLRSSPTYDILFLLKSLEVMNRFMFHLISHERISAFAEGRIDSLDTLKLAVPAVSQNEFMSSKLTEKLEQQMRDSLAVSIGGMPAWCNQLMAWCPFLFGFEARCKYFRLAAFGPMQVHPHLPSHNNLGAQGDRRPNGGGGLPRKKFQVSRDHILDSAAQMMDLHARHKVVLEVEYKEEVGTGLGPTLEFYTLVSQEFQKSGMNMWREDHSLSEDSEVVTSPFGLFPRPWSPASNGVLFSEVIKKFVLLGQVVAKALQDGRVLDLPFSKVFYKLILGQELGMYDIQSFDPELGRALLEFKAFIDRKRFLDSVCGENSTVEVDSCFRNTKIEDLCLDFTLPGYPDYVLATGDGSKMVNMNNLEEYVSLIVDATVSTGIFRQVEAFKSGFNQVFPIKNLEIFTEEELERLFCGEHDSWASNELLDHVKFDHGYTASSPPIINLLEIIQEFDRTQRRAFLQFVTGAPRLPPGGLKSLNPKLTIVRKHCSKWADADLPSVMTCANYLKLPPYSSKEMMLERLLYAISEGQGSFHLS